MNDSHLKRLGLVIGLLVVVLASALYLVARPPSRTPATLPPAPAANPIPQASTTSTQPKITWSVSSLQPILSPGESSSNTLTFVSSGDLTNVTVEAVPAIAPFVTISPSTFASVSAGQAQSVQIIFSIPQGTALGIYEGTIHVRTGSSTLPQTLKVVIQTGKLFSTSSYSIMYPADWTFSQTEANQTGFIPPGKQPDLGQEYIGDIVIEAISKSATSDLQTFYQNNAVVNLFLNSQGQTSFVVNGFPAVKFTGVSGMISTDIVAVDIGATVIEVSDVGQLHQSDGILDLMVNTVH